MKQLYYRDLNGGYFQGEQIKCNAHFSGQCWRGVCNKPIRIKLPEGQSVCANLDHFLEVSEVEFLYHKL